MSSVSPPLFSCIPFTACLYQNNITILTVKKIYKNWRSIPVVATIALFVTLFVYAIFLSKYYVAAASFIGMILCFPILHMTCIWDDLESLAQNTKEFAGQNSLFREGIIDLQSQTVDFSKNNNDLKAEITHFQKQVGELEVEIKQLTTNNQDYTEQNKILQERIATLEKSLIEFSEHNRRYSLQNHEFQGKIDRLQIELALLAETNLAYIEQSSILKAENEKLSKQLTTFQDYIGQLEETNQTLSRNVSEFSGQNEALRLNLTAYESQLEKYKSVAEEQNRNLETIGLLISNINEKTDSQQAEFGTSVSELKQYIESIGRENSALTKVQETISLAVKAFENIDNWKRAKEVNQILIEQLENTKKQHAQEEEKLRELSRMIGEFTAQKKAIDESIQLAAQEQAKRIAENEEMEKTLTKSKEQLKKILDKVEGATDILNGTANNAITHNQSFSSEN